MSKTAVVTARVEPEVKKEAEKVLSQVGLTMSQAMNLYLRQIAYQRRIPFELVAPKYGSGVVTLKRLSGIVQSGHHDTSERVNELVEEAILQKYQEKEAA